MKNKVEKPEIKLLVDKESGVVCVTPDGLRVPLLEKEASELLELLEGAEGRLERLPEVIQEMVQNGLVLGKGDLGDWRNRSVI